MGFVRTVRGLGLCRFVGTLHSTKYSRYAFCFFADSRSGVLLCRSYEMPSSSGCRGMILLNWSLLGVKGYDQTLTESVERSGGKIFSSRYGWEVGCAVLITVVEIKPLLCLYQPSLFGVISSWFYSPEVAKKGYWKSQVGAGALSAVGIPLCANCAKYKILTLRSMLLRR